MSSGSPPLISCRPSPPTDSGRSASASLRAPDHTPFDSTLALAFELGGAAAPRDLRRQVTAQIVSATGGDAVVHELVRSIRIGEASEAHSRDGVAAIVMADGPYSAGGIEGPSQAPQCANRRPYRDASTLTEVSIP